jgi:hypothetical protein
MKNYSNDLKNLKKNFESTVVTSNSSEKKINDSIKLQNNIAKQQELYVTLEKSYNSALEEIRMRDEEIGKLRLILNTKQECINQLKKEISQITALKEKVSLLNSADSKIRSSSKDPLFTEKSVQQEGDCIEEQKKTIKKIEKENIELKRKLEGALSTNQEFEKISNADYQKELEEEIKNFHYILIKNIEALKIDKATIEKVHM